MVLEVRLLGTFAVAIDGRLVDEKRWVRRQAALVVKMLALAPRQRLHQEQIMETMWPGADPDTAANGLHKMVHLARHALEPQLRSGNDSRYLRRTEGQLRLVSPTGMRVDADEFESVATGAVRDGDEGACQEALRLYEGDLLPADRFAEWAAARRDRLRTLRLQVLSTLAERMAARGELAEAIRLLQQLLAAEPTNEPAHRQLMAAFARAGSRAQALRQFEHCRSVLRADLDAEPDATTTALRDRIVAGVESRTSGVVFAAAGMAAIAAGPSTDAIAVLPFTNLTGDAAQEFLASGIAESVIRGLSREVSLRVMAPSTVQRYRGREIEPRQVGRELAVAWLLLGRLERAGRHLAVSVELVRAEDGTMLWGERFDHAEDRLPEIERTIAMAVVVRLLHRRDRSEGEPTSPSTSPAVVTHSAAAYQHYLRGRHEWNRRTPQALAVAQRHFERAIAADGRFALAHSGLADCHSLATLYAASAPHTSMPLARDAARRALELAPDLAEAHTSLAYVQFAYEWDFPAAEAGFARAIALSPNYATAHQWLHELLAADGRVEQQRAAVARAHALDPLSPLLATEIGWGLYFAGEAGAACRHLERTVAAAPQFALAWLILGLAQLQGGDEDAACQTLGHAVRLSGSTPVPLAIGALGNALARAGRVEQARAVSRRLGARRPNGPAAAHAQALVQAGLGDERAALRLLELAFAGRADRLVYMRVEPMFEPLRPLPAFTALQAQLAPLAGEAPVAPARGKTAGRRRQVARERRGRSGS